MPSVHQVCKIYIQTKLFKLLNLEYLVIAKFGTQMACAFYIYNYN